MERVDEAWKGSEQVKFFLEGIRGAIPFFEAQLKTMMRLIEGLPAGAFLDLGCGDGILSSRILRAYPEARGTLLDFSPPMLEKARKALSDHGSNINFLKADLTSEDWPADVARAGIETFDIIVSGYAIHHLPNEVKKRVYGSVFSLLNPGGIFINIDHVSSPSERLKGISNGLFIESIREFHEKKGGPGDFEAVKKVFMKRVSGEGKVLAPLWDQCRWLSEIGFIEVDCSFKSFELAVFGGRKPVD